ncbi:hypothetical protein Amet_2264 [Alkaliphilus metalliredigens QYMF]|uniref:GIY-YIG domain-containing protein n=1 Tax=Alkaliphilus metalliredigens (strain QYMF) TaxID=293826 RepID=A6TQF4_ALKMQ|nr:GIY-YIG nuclease family protein [Alkaliphilus metalliredigens]ABR48422.1 hypothetical protein Amet_2264 [Alkaliphilus metalliredigens QYMF]
MQEIILKWFGPYDLERIQLYDLAFDKGIYMISRIWGEKETLLYIGRTKREFQKRLKEHDVWIKQYRGQIKIRLGLIMLHPDTKFSEKLLADVEALLIILNKTVENTSNTSTYSGRALTINNTGRRGLLDKRITSNSDLLEDIN